MKSFLLPLVFVSVVSCGGSTAQNSDILSESKEIKLSCSSMDDNQPYNVEKLSVSVKKSEIQIVFDDIRSKKVPAKYELDASYSPRTEETKKFLRFKLTETDLFAYPDGEIREVFVEKTIFAEQNKGIVRFTGAGFFFAKYKCG